VETPVSEYYQSDDVRSACTSDDEKDHIYDSMLNKNSNEVRKLHIGAFATVADFGWVVRQNASDEWNMQADAKEGNIKSVEEASATECKKV